MTDAAPAVSTAIRSHDSYDVRDLFVGHLAHFLGGADAPAPDAQLLGALAQTALMVSAPVQRLILELAPALLRQLSRLNEPERIESRREIRGRVDWSATYKARMGENNDRSLYVCRQIRRQFDTLENRLLRYTLVRLLHLTTHLPPWLANGIFWNERSNFSPVSIALQTGVLRRHLQSHLRHVYLREVATPEIITGRHVQRARLSKSEMYSEVADMFELHRAAFDGDMGRWLSILQSCVVLPANGESEEARQTISAMAWVMARQPASHLH
jgi:hypothetical protein